MTQEEIGRLEKDEHLALQVGDASYDLLTEDVEITTEDMPGWLVMNDGQLTVALDIALSEELVEEGLARELINRIQNLRKSSGLEVTDRIRVTLSDNRQLEPVIQHFGEYIASQVLATSLSLAALPDEADEIEVNGIHLHIRIQK